MSKWRVIFCGVLLSMGLVSMAQASLSDSLTVEDLKENGVLFTPHNRVTLLPSGAEKFEDMFKAIEQARHYIYLEYFNFRNDSIGKALFTLLDKKVREGVKVRVIYDDFGNVSNDRPLRKRHLRQLKRRHFEVVVFDPIVFPWVNHALHRDHRKIVVIDDKVVYTGGMNVADYYIHGRPEFGKWRDMHMRLEGDCVPLYRRIFCEMWERCTGDKIDSLEYQTDSLAFQTGFRGLKETACADSSGVLLGVANREPKRSPAIIRRSYIDAIDNAQKRIQIVNPYFTLVPSVKKALYRALKRGVKLEVMLSTKCDVPVMPDVAAYHAKRLMKRGADIYYYEDGFHHSKVMMVDSTFCTVGSANLNSRSLKFDYEVNAFIVDSCTTRELQSIFEADKHHSTLLTPENWKKRRSFGRRFMGWFYHLLIPLI
ncbi:phosphatidylserine/phosphatidylglycerophosphate/cardiolipin synthase family protein [Paraprevotella clara]|uniref:phospholipase D-like domain-containing protein n=1 Tax=Paraprevotella clara TaxID=454154 RepID=UPI00307740CD